MSVGLIKKLRDERAGIRTSADSILARYEESGDELNEADRSNLEALETQATALDDRIKELVESQTARANAAAIDAQFDDFMRTNGRESGAGIYTNPRDQQSSMAEMIAASDLSTYAERGAMGTAVMRTELSVIKSIDANGNPLAPAQRLPDAALPIRRTPILDAIGYERITVGNASWLEFPCKAPEAGKVAEAGKKPEAKYEPVVREGALDKYAHIIPLTSEAIADNPRLVSVVQGAMTDGVRVKAERSAAEVIAAGIAENPYPTATGDALWKAIRMGVAMVQQNEFVPSAVLVNPLDWAEVDIEMVMRTLRGMNRDSDLWNLTAIPSFKVAAGTAYVGDFNVAFKFLDRGDFQVAMTDSHGTNFEDNIYTLRAEQRGRVVIERPEAIAKVAASVASGYTEDYTELVGKPGK